MIREEHLSCRTRRTLSINAYDAQRGEGQHVADHHCSSMLYNSHILCLLGFHNQCYDDPKK